MPIAALWPLPQPPLPSPGGPAPTLGAGQRGEADYLAALQALLPRGRAWSRDGAAVMTAVLAGWARCYARVDARQTNLLADAFPASTVELLPEWEASLGLPDPCLGPLPSLQQRQAQVLARMLAGGGQSVGYLTAYAAALGFPVAITEFAPFRAGISSAGQAMGSAQGPVGSAYFTPGSTAGGALVVWAGGTPGFDWSFALLVTVTAEPTEYFRAGQSAAGEPIANWQGSQALAQIHDFTAGIDTAGAPIARWGAPLLECELRRVAPAEAVLIFAYGA